MSRTTHPAYENRHRQARRAAILDYAIEHDRAAEQEQIDAHLLGLGLIDPEVAQANHERACLLLRAYLAEMDNPKPDGLR